VGANLHELLPESLLDTLYEAVYVTDTDRRIVYWNRAAEQLTGFQSAEVVGHCCAENILQHVNADGESLCAGRCPLSGVMSSGQPCEAVIFLHRKSGARIPVRARCFPVRDSTGRIVGGIEVFADASSLEAMQERLHTLERLAYVDALTQVSNRRHIEVVLGQRLDEFARYGWPCGVLLADVDQFKQVNYTHGHPVGDRALQMVAATIAANIRSFDAVGRWGGEEFLVVLPQMNRDLLSQISERICVLVARSFLNTEKGTVRVTVSIGAAIARTADTLEDLVKRADDRLYESKRSGRNRVTLPQAPTDS
jgi:diguanylate cyclase (GGDEF)-like protein/PAS domain S-box-containing protein